MAIAAAMRASTASPASFAFRFDQNLMQWLRVDECNDARPSFFKALESEDTDDVRMFELSDERGFALKSCDAGRVGRDIVWEPNHDDRAVALRLAIDHLHAHESAGFGPRQQRAENTVLPAAGHFSGSSYPMSG
jgi:hypothetical protein